MSYCILCKEVIFGEDEYHTSCLIKEIARLRAELEVKDKALLAGLNIYFSVLEQENADLRRAMQDFVDKVDRGEARSKRTYARFKELLQAQKERKVN